MKTKIEIKSIWGKSLYSCEKENNTIKKTLEEARGKHINLEGANLSGSKFFDLDLSELDLSGMNLNCANLSFSRLSRTDLTNTNLDRANFSFSRLNYANLSYTNLRQSNFRGASLFGADLTNADLTCADLSSIDLCKANLNGANLKGAKLSNIITNKWTAFFQPQCPSEGSFVGWKRCGNYIVKLLITENAQRSSATSLECRCSEVLTLDIQNLDGSKADVTSVSSNRYPEFIYEIGKISHIENFDGCRWDNYSTGIHFFIAREMAVNYNRTK